MQHMAGIGHGICQAEPDQQGISHWDYGGNLRPREAETMKTIVRFWLWWLERNRIREGENIREPSMNAFAISQMSDEYLAIAAKEAKGSRVSRQKLQWRKLKADFL